MSEGLVGELYNKIKELTVDFTIRPGERINEVELAKKLDASRTPLREALNRLVAERLIEFRPGKGFFCRQLDPETVFELYQMREILEVAAARLATKNASDEDIYALKKDLYDYGFAYEGKTVGEVVELDERFHMGIARLSGNRELVAELERLNDKLRFIRWIDMSSRVQVIKGEHKTIIAALVARDKEAAVASLEHHISMRMDQVIASVKEGYSNMYVLGADAISGRAIEEVYPNS